MTFPNVPTDNLYKFLALTGLIMILFGIYSLYDSYEKFTTEINKLTYEIEMAGYDGKQLGKDVDELTEDLKKDSLNLSQLHRRDTNHKRLSEYIKDNERMLRSNPNELVYLKFCIENFEFLYPEYTRNKEQKERLKEIKAKQKEIHLKDFIMKTKITLLEKDTDRISFLVGVFFVMVCIGFIIARINFIKWKKLIQEPTDRKMELEISELEKKVKSVSNDSHTMD